MTSDSIRFSVRLPVNRLPPDEWIGKAAAAASA
jgi:hypothetical protein